MGTIVNPTPTITALEAQRHAYNALSMSEYDTGLEPQLYGVIEVAGAIYEMDDPESITGWSGISDDTEVYIKLVPNIGAGTIAAEFTTTAPVFSTAYQGFYGTGGSASHRYVGGLYRESSTEYDKKWMYAAGAPAVREFEGLRTNGVGWSVKIIEIGDWNMVSTANLTIDPLIDETKIRAIRVMIREDSGLNDAIYPIDYATGPSLTSGGAYVNGSNGIFMQRFGSSIFNTNSYDATSYNRGWITIWYEV
jgi:hypothetical protein